MTSTRHTDARQNPATIAIDARLVGYAAGIARYTTQLVRALAELDTDDAYVVLQSRRAREPLVASPRVRYRRFFVPPHHRLERLALPLELLTLSPAPALLHSVDHVAPRWGPWRSVVTVHDLAFLRFPETHTPESRAYYAAAGESARQAARVIAVSRSTASDVVRLLGVDPQRVRVVYEAAAPAFTPRPRADFDALATRLELDGACPYLLAVGTLEPRKNIPLLLEAFARLRRRTRAQLLVVGQRGWLDAPIFEARHRLGLGESVRFLGGLPEDDLAILYSHAGVVAFPSHYEGFGLVLLEAMACGAPVVCSNAPPMPEIVGDAAQLLPPTNAGHWADTLARVLEDQALAADLRSRGFRRAAQFSWDQTARATHAVYREALLA